MTAWLESRKPEYKVASVRAWQQVVDGLTAFLGFPFPIAEVTPEKAEEFRQRMISDGLRPTTIQKRLQHARLMFDHAKRKNLLAENTFEHVRHRPGDVFAEKYRHRAHGKGGPAATSARRSKRSSSGPR